MTNAELKTKLNNSVEHLKSELAQIRTGRVTPSLLDSVKVNAYGTQMSVKEVGTISTVDAQTLQITPWDKNMLDSVAKAIRESELKLNPVVQATHVIVPIPSLTEERRKEFTRLVSTKTEETKQAIRNIRQDAMKDIDVSFEKKEFGEDEKFTLKEKVEEIVKECVEEVEEISEQKKKDIMQI